MNDRVMARVSELYICYNMYVAYVCMFMQGGPIKSKSLLNKTIF